MVQARALNEYKLTAVSSVVTHDKDGIRIDRFKTGNEKRNPSDFNLKSLSKWSSYSGMNRNSYHYLKNTNLQNISDFNREFERQTSKLTPTIHRIISARKNLMTLSDLKLSKNIHNFTVNEKSSISLNRSGRHLQALTEVDSNSSIVNISFANLEMKHQLLVLPKPSFESHSGNNSTKFLTMIASNKDINTEQELEKDSDNDQVTTQDIWMLSYTDNDSVADGNTTECTNNSACGQRLDHAPIFHTHTLVKGIVLLNLGILACVGNVATLTSILRRGRQHSSTVYLLLVHLSVSDLFVTTFCIIGEGFWTLSVEWYGGDILCKIFKFLQMFSLYLSTFVLVVIGFDRLCAVKFPMRRIKARMQVHRAVTGAWVLSAVLSAPQAVIFRVAKGPFIEDFYQCVTYGFYTAAWQEQVYTSFSLLFMFLIPLGILITTYSTTFATIASRTRIFGGPLGPLDDARCKMLRKAKIKSLWITVVIVSTFIICWTPYYISMIISVFLEPDEQLGQTLHDVIFFFGSSTAVLNPVIYGAFHLRKRGKPASSTQSSSKFEPSFALSTMRKVRCSNGRYTHTSYIRDTRRSTQGSNAEFF
ncbi:Gonadotropin-releasing hormone receptor like protein [Argiope bruennichi]|uniref:Gonadotropin-releasing hormone receptor like protein n=2 Tax=Argiope bruennichi TaxID=94029 RepID=A0A8T0FPE2_ARGBR|nr:Gonadotropin-releasing hormone receptor like protein [Argiope bruennichi]